jgi:hypothetical protein
LVPLDFMIGSLDPLLFGLHDTMTCETCSFLIQRLGVTYFENEKWGNSHSCSTLPRPIQSHTYTWYSFEPTELSYTSLSLIKHRCLLSNVMHPCTLVIHVHVDQTKSTKCGSQAALHPPERKRERVRNNLAWQKRGKMEEARVKHHSRTFFLPHTLSHDQSLWLTWSLRGKLFDLAT